MKIAVTSQNFREVTGHAGKTRRFLIYEGHPDQEPVEIDRLDLPKELAFHELHGKELASHPVDVAEILITGGAGAGFVQRLAQRGIKVYTTTETDPVQAVKLFFAGKLSA
jgi:predicted Fe-Mo cluster-binding NifX family protein